MLAELKLTKSFNTRFEILNFSLQIIMAASKIEVGGSPVVVVETVVVDK